MTDTTHRALGLTDSEYDDIIEILGREPNHVELAMFSVMWSEHCSYKSSKTHLRRLPTTAPWVLVGPGENAGVIDAGDGIAVALRIESHNHPSAIEPYQGAATGVGGIIRDIFTMGARPIALMDPLRFGPLDDARSRWIADGVVSGVSGYGNSVGVPTVGGETVFDQTYKGNPLVNVFCLGVLPVDRLVLGQASGVGNLAVLLGSTTGRDGIGGVSVLASAGFGDEETEATKRPSVQVGDPFEEKRLIEACLELLDSGLVVGIQDLGGAGLVCATSETASRAGMGMDVYVDAVPRREPNMEPFEVMISESQERMLAIVEPENLDATLEICRRWEILASVVGTVTEGGQLRIMDVPGGTVVGEVPASALHDAAPEYQRPLSEPADLEARRAETVEIGGRTGDELAADLRAMLADTSWVSSQYDHQLFLNTVVGPGADAAVLRLKHPATGEDTGRGMALSADGNHRWCAVDPKRGTEWLVVESLTNVSVAGGEPKALVNCLNFGNPEHPEVMWQLSQAVDGMTAACEALDVPVIGGNVSLYNESQGVDIDPTPVVATLGMIDRLDQVPPRPVLVDGAQIVLLGDGPVGLAGSRWAWDKGIRTGSLGQLDFDAVRKTLALVRGFVSEGLLLGAHDVAEGGLGGAVAEMAAASGVGARIARIDDAVALFGECPGRVVACVSAEHVEGVLKLAEGNGVSALTLGVAGGESLEFEGLFTLAVDDIRHSWAEALPSALGSGSLSA